MVKNIKPLRLTCRDQVKARVAFSRDGATDEEIMVHVQYGPNTVRPRRVELVQEGLLFDSGLRRKTVSGKDAIVWKAGCPK